MNKLPSQAGAWARALRERRPATGAEIAVLPPLVDLPLVAAELLGGEVAYGAQDVSRFESGAHTGEVSAAMLADLGCRYAVVGHSERRALHFETDEVVAAKARAAQAGRLSPIVCVGESLDVRELGRQVPVTLTQLRGSLQGVAAGNLVVAYEPVWAIGTGLAATASDAEEMALAIRGALGGLYGEAGGVRVLYGGSVKASNVAEICGRPSVGGVLVGGASLELEGVLEMARALG